MKTKKYLAVLFILIFAVLIKAQQVTRIETPSTNLSDQFNRAFESEKPNDNFWIGYSIIRNSDRDVMVGSFYTDDRYNPVTLRDIISNNQKAIDYFSHYKKKDKAFGRSFRIINGTSIDKNVKQDRETAILFLYDKDSKSINDFREIDISSLSRSFELWGYPLMWLGKQDNKKSVDFLFSFYKNLKETKSQKKLIAAIGVHTDQYPVTTFLKNIILSKADPELRKNTGFWLGLQNNSEALTTLKQVVNNDPVLEVRKNAVWGIGYIQLPETIDELVYIAKHNSEREVRRNAIYALGNMAVRKAEDALKDFVDNDPDVEIKKTAVYALSNSSNDAIPYLIKIAKTNSSLEVRKSAIYSLGNSDDKRALNALIDLAKN